MFDCGAALPLRSISHLSRTVEDLERSVEFYTKVLGFQEIKRPSCLDCEGSWLFGYGIALHLIAGPAARHPRPINPQDDHTSFTTSAELLPVVMRRLKEWDIPSVVNTIVEGGVRVTQVFFHCPDHHMIEVCNCDCIPIEPLPATQCTLQQKAAPESCQLQHKQSPMEGRGSMELSSMHFLAA